MRNILSEVQGKLKDQAQSLADRMKARELAGANAAFTSFVKDMEAGRGCHDAGVEPAEGPEWNDALPPEQKALQYLLRAEATFRDIQVSFGQQGGGGGGGGGASRDLESLFDLELDKDKNQYEASQQSASETAATRTSTMPCGSWKNWRGGNRRWPIRLKQQQTPQQRWQQEMLRREAEQLRQQMEQLAAASSRVSKDNRASKGSRVRVRSPGQSGQSGQQSGRAQQQSPMSRGQQQQQQQRAISRTSKWAVSAIRICRVPRRSSSSRH